MHPKTNETNKSLLESVGYVALLATKKMIAGLKTHLEDYNTTTAKHLNSYRDHSSQVKKTKAGITLQINMQW